MAQVVLEEVNKEYGSVRAVVDVNLTVADGEFVVLVGPSGCGKSTTLRMVAGLEEITRGLIRIGERVVNRLPPKDRDIAMVFQNYALYQHMTAYDNLAFGLRNRKVPEADIKTEVMHAAIFLVDLFEDDLGHDDNPSQIRRPRTTYFCANKVMMIAGPMAMTAIALIRFQAVPSSVTNWAMVTVISAVL